MATDDTQQPYMIYMGPRPARLTQPDALSAEAKARAVEEWRRAHPDAPSSTHSHTGVVAAVLGALVAGLLIGVWTGPILRLANPGAPSTPTPAFDPPAAAPEIVAAPAAEPSAPVAHVMPMAPLEEAARPKPTVDSRPKAAAPKPKAAEAKTADSRPKAAVAAHTGANSAAAAATTGCKADGSRAQVMICADPALAQADEDMRRAYQRAMKSSQSRALLVSQEDWLITSEVAASRSPADLADAYRKRIAELNAVADEPPH